MTIEIEKQLIDGDYELKNVIIIDGENEGTKVETSGNFIKVIISNEKKDFDLWPLIFLLFVVHRCQSDPINSTANPANTCQKPPARTVRASPSLSTSPQTAPHLTAK